MSSEVSETFRRPSRVLLGPVLRLIPLLLRYPRLLTLMLPLLPAGLIERAGRKRFYFQIGYELLQHDRPSEAWAWFQVYLRLGKPSIDDYLVGALCLYHGLGRFPEAMGLLASANAESLRETDRLGIDRNRFRVLDSVWARHIGHTATIDYVIKLGMLEGRRREDTLLYLPQGSPVANRFLLDQIATQLRLVEDAADLPFDPSAVQTLHYDYLGPCLPDRTTEYFWQVAGRTYKRWHEEGRAPLFKLPLETVERGWAALRSAGLAQGAWFVALHVREGKWDGKNPGLHGVMNSEASTYLPAIAEITRRGGWVVRMGDPGMRPLPELPKVIDYCHSPLRSDWMDIFLATQCRFMLGSASGPVFIPPIYGVPALLTNWWPPAHRPLHASETFIPKLFRRKTDGRYLTLSETLAEPFAYCHSLTVLGDQKGVRVEDNDPELIRAAVEEMFMRLDGDLPDDAELSELRSKADRIYDLHESFGMGRLARDFLHRYRNLIA